ncbi:hypothetical protein DRN69_06245 [Candidatus Pacearchaeota archaeon]|nr:MAG: hypothetical protein DRN69_06245 [Candidatus Pacearchaeota archaeon]
MIRPKLNITIKIPRIRNILRKLAGLIRLGYLKAKKKLIDITTIQIVMAIRIGLKGICPYAINTSNKPNAIDPKILTMAFLIKDFLSNFSG